MISNLQELQFTKSLQKEEIVPANNLRTMSQKLLVEMLSERQKIGLIVNNELSIAMIEWSKYEQIIDTIQQQDTLIQQLVNMLEDVELASLYGESIQLAENGQSKSYYVDSAAELFKLLD